MPGTVLVRRRDTAAPAPFAEAAARTEATAPLPDFERGALAELQRDLAEAHKLYFKVSGVGVVSGGRFQVSLACPDSEWLDRAATSSSSAAARLPQALRTGLEGTFARIAQVAERMGAGRLGQDAREIGGPQAVTRPGHGGPPSVKARRYLMRWNGDSRAPLPRFWADRPIVGQFPDSTAQGADVRFFMDQELAAGSATAWLWHDPCDKVCGGRLFFGARHHLSHESPPEKNGAP